MTWYFAVAEREHELQNPTSVEKIRWLGERLRLRPASRVLDMAAGRGGPALVLAEAFGCRVTCVERAAEFHAAAVHRARARRLDHLVECVHADAATFPVEPERYDAALCLGATFVWGGLDRTLAALTPTVRRGGHVVVGEPFWRRWPLPDEIADDGYTSLAGTVERFKQAGLGVVSLIVGSEDDWDRYESLHWQALEEWLTAHADDPDAEEMRRTHDEARDRYLGYGRELLGWAMFAGWKSA